MENENVDYTEKERAFLIGLTRLTRETGIIIGGCGCCGSPYLQEADAVQLSDARSGYAGANGEVRWISPDDGYEWEERASEIVRRD